MSLLTSILNRFRKPRPPNLKDALKKINDIAETLDNYSFYLTQLTDHRLTEVQVSYLNKAVFNLSSARDELQISVNELKDKKFMEARLGKSRN